MEPEASSKKPKTPLFKGISDLTKNAIERIAQFFVAADKNVENESSSAESKTPALVESKSSISEKKQTEPETMTKTPQTAAKAPIEPLPAESAAVETETLTSSSIPGPVPVAPPPVEEPSQVWSGEEGPSLPTHYGITVLQAMARDPQWVYLYWEVSEETREQICAEEGEWVFDTSTTLIRVLDERGETVQEIPILLDTHCWYLSLPASQTFEFDLGLKKADGSYCSLARSNRLTLPPAESSQATDEKWAAVSEEFEEILQHAGGLDYDITPAGDSSGLAPHVLRHRVRMDWVPFHEIPSSVTMLPSSHVLPSSHSLPSSHTQP